MRAVPVYEYRCPICDVTFAERRPMAESSAAASCPDGHPGARRLLSVFAAVGSPAQGSAPMAAPSGGGRCCGGGCGCH
jgi:putative FmdB family regulatory protein